MSTWLIALEVIFLVLYLVTAILVSSTSSPFAAGVHYAVTGWLLGFTLSFAATPDRHVCSIREELGYVHGVCVCVYTDTYQELQLL